MNQDEHRLQVAICNYLDHCNYEFFAIPNGGLRNIKVAAKLKREGVKAGVADLFIAMSNGIYNGLFIEVKVGKNRQQPNQKLFEQKVKENGFQYKIVRSIDDMVAVIKEYRTESRQVRTYSEGYKDGMLNAQITKI